MTGADRYEFQELIGEGATSRVYRAFDRETRSPVAVKVLNPHLRTDAVSLERLRRELAITRRINHPQIVSIYDLVEEPDRTFLVMELLGGLSLKNHIALRHPLPPASAASILRQILEVLAVCHAADVVHRDLKPQNVFIDDKGRVKLLDFGIARMTSLRDMTQTGTSLGSPEYMAPELFATNTYDPRTDLYAAGVIGFELLAGRLPFQGDTLAMLFRAHREEAVPSLRELREDVPAWLEQLVAKLLAKRCHERYQSAEEALDDLEQQRVLSSELPQLPQRPCLACDEATPAELAVCIRCGADGAELSRPGSFDLRSKLGESHPKLAEFLAECLDLELAKPAHRQTLLLQQLDRRSAELLRRRAARRQLYLEVRPSPWAQRWLPTLPLTAAVLLLGCLVIPAAAVKFQGWYWEFWRSGGGPDIPLLGVMGIRSLALLFGLASLVTGPYAAWRIRVGRRPLIPDLRRGRLGRLRSWAFIDRLAPVLARAPAGRRAALSGMIDRYLLLLAGEPLDAGRDAKLQGLLESTAALESLAWQIEAELDDSQLARVTQQYDSACAALEQGRDPARGDLLAQVRGELTERLRTFSRLEELHSSLTNRLTRVEAAFNRLAIAELVLRAPFDELELDALAEALDRAVHAAEAHREIIAGAPA